jgi:hypothetical protein
MKGIHHFVIQELEPDECGGFKGFLRMNSEVFNEILGRIEPQIRRDDTIMRDSITPHEMLVVTLRFLATGDLLTHFFKRVNCRCICIYL